MKTFGLSRSGLTPRPHRDDLTIRQRRWFAAPVLICYMGDHPTLIECRQEASVGNGGLVLSEYLPEISISKESYVRTRVAVTLKLTTVMGGKNILCIYEIYCYIIVMVK